MNDFWEWMEEKEYGRYGYIRGTSINPTRQMLIGYMMEYLREKEGKIILNTGGRATIKDVYERYVKDIEKVGKDMPRYGDEVDDVVHRRDMEGLTEDGK